MKDDVTLLAIDDHLLPFRRNLCYYMTRPSVRKEPVIAPGGAADANSAHFFGTVIHDVGRYRIWYYGKRDQSRGGGPCYAESDDGLSWTKPDLGQVEIGATTHCG